MEPDELVDTVKQYLDTHSNQYINALEEIRDILKSYQRSGTGKQAIYRITSRGDYQEGGSHIKKEAEIVEKIRRKRVKDPSYSESSVPDYIGLRLVCVYPSDIPPIAHYIIRKLDIHEAELNIPEGESTEFLNAIQQFLRSRDVEQEINPKPNDRGYRALHFVVSPKGTALRCEIQIVTLLQETWAYKTHDTVYKNKAQEVLEEHKKHTKYLSDVLWTMDQHSEFVKEQIEKERKNDELRRNILIKDQLLRILSPAQELEKDCLSLYDPNGIDFSLVEDPAVGIGLLKRWIQDKSDQITFPKEGCSVPDVSDVLMAQVRGFEKKFNPFASHSNPDYCSDLMRIATLATINDESGQRGSTVLDLTEKFLQRARSLDSNELIATGWLKKGWLLFCMDRLKEAIVATRRALDLATTHGLVTVSNKAKANVAYFQAERLDRTLGRDRGRSNKEVEEAKKECFELIGEIPATPQREDTMGYIQIVFGRTVEDIEKGLALCAKAFESATEKEKQITALFFLRHKRRAHERCVDVMDLSEGI